MDALQAKHRKELRDLQSRVTQKKKSATKKTRKGVNDECDQLERELKERQAAELAALDNPTAPDDLADPVGHPDPVEEELAGGTKGLEVDGDGDGEGKEEEEEEKGEVKPVVNGASTNGDQAQRKKPNRAKARLARRAAEQEALSAQAAAEAANLPDQKQVERQRMLAEFKQRGLQEKVIRADGHCLYSAVADQMAELGLSLDKGEGEDAEKMTPEPYRQVRKTAADYIQSHPDDFAPFLEEPLQEYVRKVRDTGEWGGQLELMALAKSYGIRIRVLQGDGRVEDIVSESAPKEDRDVWLAYYKHGFGLGEHYNSLRKAGVKD